MKIENRVLKLENVKWRSLVPLQPEGFKELSDENMSKLMDSLSKNNFIASFIVWQSDDKLYIIDGVHRQRALLKLSLESNINIPEELPAQFIECSDMKEAAKLVLIYSSAYAHTTQTGFDEFMQMFDFSLDELSSMVSIPDIQLDIIPDAAGPEILPETIDENIPSLAETSMSAVGDIFEIGEGNFLICGDSFNAETFDAVPYTIKADCIFTDPPYNGVLGGGGFKDDAKMRERLKKQGKSIESIYSFSPKEFLPVCEIFKAPKCNMFFWCNKNLVPDYLNYASDTGRAFNIFTWHKTSFLPTNYNKPFPDTEYCIKVHDSGSVYVNGLPKSEVYYGKFWVIDMPKQQEHPTIKPAKIIHDILLIYSLPGGLVMDFFAGSGSTLIVSHSIDRKFIGCELDPKYVDLILKRFKCIFPDTKFRCLNRDFDFTGLFELDNADAKKENKRKNYLTT